MVSPLFKKLNLSSQRIIHVLNEPESFDSELASLEGVEVRHTLVPSEQTTFAIAFVQTQDALDAASKILTAAAAGDAILWFAYPKGSSKRYQCEFNRDSGWTVLGAAGFEAVRQVAIDADWSALRFRRVEYIKSLTRDPSRAGSSVGKARTTQKGK